MLDIREDDVVLDATLGGAGHTRELARLLGEHGIIVGIDADPDAIARAEDALRDTRADVRLVEGNFRRLGALLPERGVSRITKALFDLGWSSYQLAAGRGFSFRSDEPLLMTYGTPEKSALTAKIIVNTWEESSLRDIIAGWGEERFARRIARAIVLRRSERPFETSRDLAETVFQAVPAPARHARTHPATRTFQALRIAVNDEIGALEEGLRAAYDLLAPGGRIAVITFHSIEDRVVKLFFAAAEKSGKGRRLTKKPVIPDESELAENPRARSAKLRVFEKKQ